jgi:hypothetical protein
MNIQSGNRQPPATQETRAFELAGLEAGKSKQRKQIMKNNYLFKTIIHPSISAGKRSWLKAWQRCHGRAAWAIGILIMHWMCGNSAAQVTPWQPLRAERHQELVLRASGELSGGVTLAHLGGTLLDLQIDVSGEVTHLGKSRAHLHTIADFSGPLPTPIPPSTGVITAANGDTISFKLKWTIEEVAPGVFNTAGPFEITGGTGRFAGASGEGDYTGRVDVGALKASANVTGEIVLPGGK